MKLNLGACDRRFKDFLSVDIKPPADIVTDLSQRWPWCDSTVEEVLALDVFEHLPDKRHTMSELWRVLCNGGRAIIEVPCAAHGAGAFQDPTHVSFWTGNDFEYYESGNANRERLGPQYGITARFTVVAVEHYSYQGKWDEVFKVRVELRAVK